MTTDSLINSQTIKSWLAEAEQQIKARSDYLTQLDAAIGDGDHGTNMRRGFDAVGKALAGEGNGLPPGQLLTIAGKTLVATVGGASGPLWGSGLRRAGRALGTAEAVDCKQLADALDEAVAGIVDLGQAAPGDATMIDALKPAAEALHKAAAAGQPLQQAIRAAAAAAKVGAESTVPMQARKGRASYLGPRSIGHQDPGATSAAIVIAALSKTIANARD
jgi:dihydroxyacetone kinase-like protein